MPLGEDCDERLERELLGELDLLLANAGELSCGSVIADLRHARCVAWCVANERALGSETDWLHRAVTEWTEMESGESRTLRAPIGGYLLVRTGRGSRRRPPRALDHVERPRQRSGGRWAAAGRGSERRRDRAGEREDLRRCRHRRGRWLSERSLGRARNERGKATTRGLSAALVSRRNRRRRRLRGTPRAAPAHAGHQDTCSRTPVD